VGACRSRSTSVRPGSSSRSTLRFLAITERGEEEELSIPSGRFACLRYTRTDPDAVWRFWFARELPGQPVRYEREVSGEIVFSAILIDNTP